MWILILVIAVVAIAAASPMSPYGITISEDCKTITMHDPLQYLKHELEVFRAKGWTTSPASREETKERILTGLRMAYPRCADIIPDTFASFRFDDLVDEAWRMAQGALQPGMDAAGEPAPKWIEAIAQGASFDFGSIAQVFPGTIDPGAFDPEPKPPGWQQVDE